MNNQKKISSDTKQRSHPRRWLALLLTLVMIVGMVPATAYAAPVGTNFVYSGEDTSGNEVTIETYTDGGWSDYWDDQHITTQRFDLVQASGGTFAAYCIDLQHSIASNMNYTVTSLETLGNQIKDTNLTPDKVKRFRAMLMEAGADANLSVLKGKVGNGIGDITEKMRITALQAALWQLVENTNNVYGNVRFDENSLGGNTKKLYNWLLGLTGRELNTTDANVIATVGAITASSYTSADKVTVSIQYKATGTNYDGSAIALTLAPVVANEVTYTPAITSTGGIYTAVFSNVPDTANLSFNISGTQQNSKNVYAFYLAGGFQSLLHDRVYDGFRQISASKSLDLSAERGSLLIKKTVNNNRNDQTVFKIHVAGPFGYGIDKDIAAGSVTTLPVKYGEYTVSESGDTIPASYSFVSVSPAAVTSISQKNETKKIEVINHKDTGSVVITKLLSPNAAGVVFPVDITQNGNIVKTVSIHEGDNTISGLPFGNLLATEVNMPEGYHGIVTTGAFIVSPELAPAHITLSNVKDKVDLGITKEVVAGSVKLNGDGTTSVNYKVTVANKGNIPMNNLTFTDTLVDLSKVTLSGTIPNALAVGGSAEFGYSYTTKDSNDTSIFTNTVSVHYGDLHWDATARVKPLTYTKFSVEKIASIYDFALPGQTITYAAIITNNGNMPVKDIEWVDAKLNTIGSLNGIILSGHSISAPIELGSFDAGNANVINEVKVYGQAFDAADPTASPTPVSNSAIVTTKVKVPSLSLDKTVSVADVLPDGSVTYTFTVRNNGTADLKNVIIEDADIGFNEKIGDLDVGHTWTADITVKAEKLVRFMGDDHIATNTATVSGTAEGVNGYSKTVTATDSVDVRVLQPNFSITKELADYYSSDEDGVAMFHAGQTVSFKITLTNTGDCTLAGISINDALLGQTGQMVPDIAPGATFVWDSATSSAGIEALKDYVTKASDTYVTNEVTASYKDMQKVAHVDFKVYNSSISLEKTAPGSATPGSSITYGFTVTNTGTITLGGVSIWDPLLDTEFDIGTLAPNQVVTRSALHTIGTSFTGALKNEAEATGWAGPWERRVTDGAIAVTAVAFTPITPNPPVTPNNVNVTLNVTIIGQGTVNPGQGTYTRGQNTYSAFTDIKPAEGWKFAGFEGPNGGEVANDLIYMNANKDVTIRFVENEKAAVVIAPSAVPQAAPEVVKPEEQTPAIEIVTPEKVPQAAPALPKTGGLPMGIFAALGGSMSAFGLLLKRRKKDEE